MTSVFNARWKSKEDCKWAKELLLLYYDRIDWEYLNNMDIDVAFVSLNTIQIAFEDNDLKTTITFDRDDAWSLLEILENFVYEKIV